MTIETKFALAESKWTDLEERIKKTRMAIERLYWEAIDRGITIPADLQQRLRSYSVGQHGRPEPKLGHGVDVKSVMGI